MYEVAVERSFRAAHAITMGGRPEPSHQHDWHVRVVVAGDLDADGLLCDFHALEEHLEAIIAPLAGRDLNAVSPFDRLNPTAEQVARHLAERLAETLPPALTLKSVSVTEAPGCMATYRPA
jgi:6-pyruvoyltetrahydropterin/6-carboxytetrahydropterin synthase